MELESFFPNSEEKNKAENFIKQFHDDLLLKDEVKDTEAVVLVIYMLTNKKESNTIDKKEAREFFENFGRNGTDFSKTVYELVNRREPPLLKEKEEGKLGLTFRGREKVKKILEGVENE